MKAILLSIKPEWVAKILNGDKTIEIRKKFPSDYEGWVYIYCSKSKLPLVYNKILQRCTYESVSHRYDDVFNELNGKVVGRFWCYKIEEIMCDNDDYGFDIETNSLRMDPLLEQSCMSEDDMRDYLPIPKYVFESDSMEKIGYAIHISKLEIFDEPRYLYSFNKVGISVYKDKYDSKKFRQMFSIQKAPQNYCYIEG